MYPAIKRARSFVPAMATRILDSAIERPDDRVAEEADDEGEVGDEG